MCAVVVFSGCSGAPDFESTGSLRQAIVDGYVDADTSAVLGLSVEAKGEYFSGACTGTLIAPNLVLTARHCLADVTDEVTIDGCRDGYFLSNREPSLFLASYAVERPHDPSDPTYFRGARVHSLTEAGPVCGFDIAVLELEGVIPSSNVAPLVPRLDSPPATAEYFSAVGYGLSAPDARVTSGLRQRLDGNTVFCSREDCDALHDASIWMSEWLSDDVRVCSGDSGGPALDEEGRVIGVASRATTECRSAVYGDVSAWGDFLSEVVVGAAERGNYEVPAWANGSALDAAQAATKSSGDVFATRSIRIGAAPEGCSLSAPPMPGHRRWAPVLLWLGLLVCRRRAEGRRRPFRTRI